MTLPSDNQSSTEKQNQTLTNAVVNKVNEALDNSAQNLPDSTLSELAKIRSIALQELDSKTQKNISFTHLYQHLIKKIAPLSVTSLAIPVAAACIIAISANYISQQSIPQIPLAMINSSIPNEDLTMLEDLEFVTWLAENEQQALL